MYYDKLRAANSAMVSSALKDIRLKRALRLHRLAHPKS